MPRSPTSNSHSIFSSMNKNKTFHETKVVVGARQFSLRPDEVGGGAQRTDAPYPRFTERSRGGPANRWLIAIAGIVMQVALGSVYAWSVFRIPLTQAYGWSISQVTLTF